MFILSKNNDNQKKSVIIKGTSILKYNMNYFEITGDNCKN